MLDPNIIRQNTDKIRYAIKSRNVDPKNADVEMWLTLDEKKKELQQELDKLNQEKNQFAKVGKDGGNIDEIREKARALKEKSQTIEEELKGVTGQWQAIMDWMPNIPLDDVPEGKNADENQETKAWIPGKGYIEEKYLVGAEGSGEVMPKFGSNGDGEFVPRPHWEIGTELDLLDLEQGGKVSGSRFYYLKNEGALIMYAIFDVLLKKLVKEGFSPMVVPLLVKEKTLYGTSHFPGDADQVYKVDTAFVEDNTELYLVGSSEPSLFAYHMDKTLNVKDLPQKMVAITPCFRSEAGSWGKDVRGMKRTHQFDKLEMDIVAEASLEKAYEIHEQLLGINEWLLQQLEIPYHVINMCTGDLGYYAAAKKYDVEVWVPSQGAFMETMSDSITTDFQARRMNIKYKDTDGSTKYAFTLNDTGATHRLLIAVLDHYQQADGSVKVPKILQEYVGKEVIRKK